MTLPFNNRLDIGEEIERKTADYIVQHLDADVEKIGSLEIDTVKPLTWRNIEGVTRRLIAPDLNIYKDGQYFSVQVKHKTAVIYADSFTGKQCFYFDVKEHTRLSRLNRSRPCVLVIHCLSLPALTALHPELPTFPDPYIFVEMDTLEPNQTLLHRRSVEAKDAFVLPLTLFKPLTELFNRKALNEPSNTNAPPKASTA
jgi:hypothetical protein|tara:strand:+ start:663 stop:1259 length:597 start_codon:yes stop_codon:yes gene_type:complete